MTYTIKELRQALKSEGFKLQVVTNSDFKSGIIKNQSGQKMPSIFTKETLSQWQKALVIRDFYKGKVFEGLYRVVI